MKYNLSFFEIMMRYSLMMIFGILFGVTLNYLFVILAVATFITAVSGWCPIYMAFGIDHSPGKEIEVGKAPERENQERRAA